MDDSISSRLHAACDWITAALLYFSIVFAPWAFGTTMEWAMRIMNFAAYMMAALLLTKWILRVFCGVTRPGWGTPTRSSRALTRATAFISAFLLCWCLTSALNASAVYSIDELQFIYRDYIQWLPHSFDARNSWPWFWNYLGLCCAFWSIRDWLLTKSENEALKENTSRHHVPARLQRLLWVLSVNSALVGIEGIIQRVDGGGKLLWLIQPAVNPTAPSQFGPYAYRANAAQYFNLVWPATAGFWYLLHRRYCRTPKIRPTHHVLLSCVMIMAACPLISDSRAGAIITVGLLIATATVLGLALREESQLVRGGLAGFALLTLILGLNVGWNSLSERMSTLDEAYAGREKMYETARKIAAEYPWFGTGPGTFDPIFQMYRSSPDEYWPGQLHNDWLELRITFGNICFSLMLVALALFGTRWFLGGGIRVPWPFPAFIGLGLAGCLTHARFDFPLLIYSIVFVFLLHCSILLSISRKA